MTLMLQPGTFVCIYKTRLHVFVQEKIQVCYIQSFLPLFLWNLQDKITQYNAKDPQRKLCSDVLEEVCGEHW
jgi:hypothetical protein